MKKLKFLLGFAGLVLTVTALQAQSIFDYQFLRAFDTNSLTYNVQYTSMQQWTESGNQTNGTMYFCPSIAGWPAYITKQFVFTAPTTNVFLSAKITVFNFSGSGYYGYGSGSLSGSTNGTSWILLMNCPTTSTNGYDYLYSNNIPKSLCGSKNLYIQVQLLSTVSPSFHGLNVAQFSRAVIVGQTNTSNGGTTNIFEVKATLLSPPPSLGIASYNQTPVVFYPTTSGTNFTLQMTTNLNSPVWVAVTNGIPFSGLQIPNVPTNAFLIQITNAPSKAFFRLN